MTASWALERRLVCAAAPRKEPPRASRCLQPLTCVLVALRSASPRVAALPHALAAISGFLDFSPRFSVPDACARAVTRAKLHLLRRIWAAQSAGRWAQDDAALYRQWAFARGTANAAARGDLLLVQWLCEVFYPHGRVTDAVEEAARAGHTHILQWLYEHHAKVFWGANEMRAAAQCDRVDVVKWLHAHTAPPFVGVNAIEWAARNGNLELVKWLHKVKGQWSGFGAGEAAAHGHLDVFKYMIKGHSVLREGALNEAAANGHLEAVKKLARRRPTLVTTRTTTAAAERGQLHVCKWLHGKKFDGNEGCTWRAAENATRSGNLEILQWLYIRYPDQFDRNRVISAADRDDFYMMEWLHSLGIWHAA
ncbi:hypothetical protein PHYPSEUDO_008757 [Phytophthora pseudosyringae]|uniref:Uncharacterized protein n=1 Tax=Phytophthora pseudosyringae TaxID=221518 RepID=A0A8T1VGP2_9STRA|nr:hypothetical protein PHYPSEUDO_008757 [Phytophthora pseudosyringae]